MTSRKWFGTDGIRGIVGNEPMTPEFFYRCGVAAATFFKNGNFIIGRDTRQSGISLEHALAAGIQSVGGQVVSIGVLPTAAVAAFAKQQRAAAGIMISASHNPHTDNGIKFFGGDGFKLDDATEYQLEQIIAATPAKPFKKQSSPSQNFDASPDAARAYREMILATLPQNFSLNGVTLVADLANGAAWQTTPDILKSLGARVITSANAPDGQNINLDCGCLHPEHLQKLVRQQNGAAIGIAHDGDADRLLMTDEDGAPLDGDEILAILAAHYQKEKRLSKNTLVATTMSNLGLDEAMAKLGARVLRTDVGDRYVLEVMRREQLNLGGESSGHILFLDVFTTGDGLLSALQVLNVMVQKNLPLRELKKILRRYPQRLINLNVRQKIPLHECPALQQTLKNAEQQFQGKGRVFLRYSGTENKIRLLLEAPNETLFPRVEQQILAALKTENIL